MTSGLRLDYEPSFVIAGGYEVRFAKVPHDQGLVQGRQTDRSRSGSVFCQGSDSMSGGVNACVSGDVSAGMRADVDSARGPIRPTNKPLPEGGHAALLAMEPDLRTLRGILAALRIFAQSSDHIDPAAVAVLASSGSEAQERLYAIWRKTMRDLPP